MKKHLFTALLLTAVISANAQLRVSSNGQVTVGKGKIVGAVTLDSTNRTDASFAVSGNDTTSNLKIMGDDFYGHGGTISFGNSKHVYIKEICNGSLQSYNRTGRLELGGLGGFKYSCGTSTILQYDPYLSVVGVNDHPFFIKRPVSAPQYLTSSDANLKTNIKPLDNMGDMLVEITPVSYLLKTDNNGEPAQKDASASQQVEERHLQYGFIAQEVKEIYPELVYEDSNGMLSIDYTGFIPLLVDAIKDMRATIQEQQTEIESLKNPVQQKTNGEKSGSIVASLSQNKPNPFKVSTSIECVIPETVSSAFICVYDLNGGQKLRRDISQRGNVEVTIEGNTLTAGMYIYALVCDGIEIDSKRMILTD